MRFEVRRRWSRLAFCLLCVAPTVAIGGAVMVTHNAFYAAARRAAWESKWSARLGLTVVADSLQQRDGEWSIQGLELRDPETDRWLLRASSLEIADNDQRLVILAHRSEICGTHWQRVSAILHEHVLQRPWLAQREVMISAATVALKYEQQAESLNAVRCELVGGADGTELLIEFQMAGDPAGEPARLRLARNRQLQPPTTGWELHTGDTPLPCSLAVPWIAPAARLGDDCSFKGMIWAELGARDWSVDLSGVFRRVQLEQLVTSQFPHKLSGVGEITLTRARFHRGRVVDLAGNLQARDGVVSQSLLEAARDELGLKLRDPISDTPLLRFDRLALGFNLDGKGMILAGQLQPEKTVLADAHGPLLSDNGEVTLPPVALLRLLVPQHEVQVPATEETAALVRILPLPKSGATSTAARPARSYTPVRLRD